VHDLFAQEAMLHRQLRRYAALARAPGSAVG
jgi:hypothetical protein